MTTFGLVTEFSEFGLTHGGSISLQMCVVGALGIPGSRYERSLSRNCFAGVFMGFSITSAVFGGIIINYNGTILAHVDNYYYYYHGYNTYYRYRRYQYSTYDTKMALSVIFLILGIAEFGMGIWAAICLCVMKPCCGPAQGPTVAFAGIPGQRMALRTDGVQVAFPVQPAGGALPVQASYMYAQGMQATSAPMPIGASGGPTPPQLVVGAGSPQEMGMELQHGKYIPV
ncbi:uncharacterized protein [Montipora capricornis]|uniref:uncharacterized protein isoform X3 n=1 Tax=Montipora capricornis TaxID=246305 RepID=UPI0035F173C6